MSQSNNNNKNDLSRLKGATRISPEGTKSSDLGKNSINVDLDCSNIDHNPTKIPTAIVNGPTAPMLINSFNETHLNHRSKEYSETSHQHRQCDKHHFAGNYNTLNYQSASIIQQPATSYQRNQSNASTSLSSFVIYNQLEPSTSLTVGSNELNEGQPNIRHEQSNTVRSIVPNAQETNPTINPLLTTEIESLFECPICFDYATPPIYQCQNGHLVCNGCSNKIKQCATCRIPITNPSIRNLQLDRLANTIQIPCKYNFNGCEWKSYCFQKRDHEDSCKFISITCPCPGTTCKWSGLLSEVMDHLSQHHKSITTLSGEDIVFLATDINLKGAVDWVMIQSCFDHHFLLVLEKQEFKSGQQLFFAVVQLIGSKKDAECFKYKLELGGSTSGHIRRLQWEAKTNSVIDGIQSAISNYDCLVFDARMADHFLTHIHQMDKDNSHNRKPNPLENHPDENLAINVTIEKLSTMSQAMSVE